MSFTTITQQSTGAAGSIFGTGVAASGTATDQIIISGAPVTSTTTFAGGAVSTVTSMSFTTMTVQEILVSSTDAGGSVVVSASLSTLGVSGTSPGSSSPSGGASTGSKISGGLATGAKVGIAVGVVVLFLLVLFLVWRLAIRRRKRRGRVEGGNGIRPPRPNAHEFLTDSNRHEMGTKYNVPEMDEQNQGKGLQAKVEADAGAAYTEPKRKNIEVHELAPGHERVVDPGLREEFPPAHELESSAPLQHEDLPLPAGNEDIAIPQQRKASSNNIEEEERRLNMLRDRIDRIREEKERLERIQELKDLEEKTKREILDAQQRQTKG